MCIHHSIGKAAALRLCGFNANPITANQTTRTNLYSNFYRRIRRYISFFITAIILSSLISCGSGVGDVVNTDTDGDNPSVFYAGYSNDDDGTSDNGGVHIGKITTIDSAIELAAIGDDDDTLSGNYILTGNIDLSAIPNWKPIGNRSHRFTGSFEGGGYNISGVSSSGYVYAGLFGYMQGASISNLGVTVDNISATNSSPFPNYVGGLVGYAGGSRINNTYVVVAGDISSIKDIRPTAYTTPASFAGGLVGYATGSWVNNTYAVVAGNVYASSYVSSFVGGLFGMVYESRVSDTYAVVAGNISATSYSSSHSNSDAGGLVGRAFRSPISNSYAEITGGIYSAASYHSSSDAGGLVGNTFINSPIDDSYAIIVGDISSTSGHSVVGGLVGGAESAVSNSYALIAGDISSVSAASSDYAGGLVGHTSSTVNNAYARVAGDISSTAVNSNPNSGGLVGLVDGGTVGNSYAVVAGDISSTTYRSASSSYAGALTGNIRNSQISNSYSSAARELSQGGFTNTYGTFKTVDELRGLTAASTGSYGAIWDATIWDFGTNADFPTLRSSFHAPFHIPARPAGFIATALGFTSLSISWDSALGIEPVYYEVYNSDEFIASVNRSTTSYTIQGLSSNTEYSYRIRACSLFGCSDFISATEITNGNNRGGATSISSAIELAAIGYNGATLSGNYILTDNIDLSAISNWKPLGNRAHRFMGSFDGNGYSISGLTSSGYKYGGLFGLVLRANINNLAVVVDDVSSIHYAGGLAGFIAYSTVSNTYAVAANGISAFSAGGLVGFASSSQISNSYAVVAGSVSSRYYLSVGGLVGNAHGSRIRNSYYSVVHETSQGGYYGTFQRIDELRGLTAATTDWDAAIWDFGTDADLPRLLSSPFPEVISSIASPASITATALGFTAISISWDSVSESVFYEVHDSSGLVASVDYPATNYTLESLLPNTEYTYRVKACNKLDCSAFISATAITNGNNEGGATPINSAIELSSIGYDYDTLSGNYILTGNIDLSAIPNWKPIGDYAHRFTGSFDGNGYNISGVSSSGYVYAGLFGYVQDAIISNLGVVVGNISAADSSTFPNYVGGLVGYAKGSQISNTYVVVAGDISSIKGIRPTTHTSFAGGLIGSAQNSWVNNTYAVVAGNIYTSSYVSSHSGGLVGLARWSPIRYSYAVVAGNISAASHSSSYSNSDAGGLVGLASDSPISNSHAEITGGISSASFLSSSSHSGGLVAFTSRNSPIDNAYAVVAGDISSVSDGLSAGGTVSGSHGSSSAGGLVGSAQSSVSSSYALIAGDISSVSASGAGDSAGGLVGSVYGTVNNTYARVAGEISSTAVISFSNSGGLIGLVYDSIVSNSYAVAAGNISSTAYRTAYSSYAGALTGSIRYSQVSNSYSSAVREPSQGDFTNTHGTFKTVDELRGLTATSTGWDAIIWDFGANVDLPILIANP